MVPNGDIRKDSPLLTFPKWLFVDLVVPLAQCAAVTIGVSCALGHMRRIHSSHKWKTPAAEASVKAAKRRASGRSEAQSLYRRRSGWYAASAARFAGCGQLSDLCQPRAGVHTRAASGWDESRASIGQAATCSSMQEQCRRPSPNSIGWRMKRR